jgi:sterol desaturase/sphingolipid hydroxylase (fatty acid hydroxylase superfamily)
MSIISTMFQPALALSLEALCVGWEKSSFLAIVRRFDRGHLGNLVFFAIYSFGIGPLPIFIGTFGLGPVLRTIGAKLCAHIHPLTTGSAPVDFALFFLLYSFATYWLHRLFHRGVWWNLHRLHHSAEDLNPLVNYRIHPMALAIYSTMLGLIAAPFVLRPEYIFVWTALNSFYDFIIHSRIKATWGWFGRWVLVPPAAHHIHHSSAPHHLDRNFTMDLIIWDRLFGTYCDDFAGVTEFGVHDGADSHHGPIYEVFADNMRVIRQLWQIASRNRKTAGAVRAYSAAIE